MSEDKTDRPATPPDLVDPPEPASTQQPISERHPAAEHSSDAVQPESTTEPTQGEIAAEQAEASLDARDDASAHYEPADHSASADSTAAYPATADSSAAAHPAPTVVAPVAAPVAASVAAERTAPESDYPATQQAPLQQRAFTPPPVAPKKKGNRGIGALIAILSVIVFLVLFAAVAAIVIAVGAPSSVGENFMGFLVSPVFYVPAIFFVIGFVLVVLLANRANWWAYILGSLFVAALVYFGTIAVGLIVNNVLLMTPAEAAADFARSASNPFIIAGALVAREVSMWIGAAISARGRRMKARNLTAREEYERAAAEHRAEYERGFAPA